MRRELLWSFFFLILGAVALCPVFLIHIGNYEGITAYEKFESFLAERQEILIALGTLFLVAGFSTLTVFMNNSTIEKNDLAQRRTEAQKLLAEFRRDWIEDLRDDCSKLSGLVFASPKAANNASVVLGALDAKEVAVLVSKIQSKVNPADEHYDDLVSTMGGMIDKPDKYKPKDFNEVVQKILKKEWDRLKRDLESAVS